MHVNLSTLIMEEEIKVAHHQLWRTGFLYTQQQSQSLKLIAPCTHVYKARRTKTTSQPIIKHHHDEIIAH